MKIRPVSAPAASTSSLGYSGGARPKPLRPRPVSKPVAAKPVATPGAPPAATTTAAAPGSTPLPVDPAYDQTEGGLRRRRDEAIAGYQAQRTSGLLDYGYTEGAGGLQFDANNPYSQAALMQKHYTQARGQSNSNFAAAGHLYAGANQGATNEINAQEGQAQDSLQKAMARFLAGNTANQATAGTDYELGVGGAMGDRVGRAGDNPLYDPVVGQTAAPAVAAAAAGGKAKAPAKAARPSDAPTRVDAVLPSKAHGGRMWKYYRNSAGKLIPIGPK